jgi:hypothetical protein
MIPSVLVNPSSSARREIVTYYRVDVHGKLRVLGQQLQFLVQHLQALLRNFVRLHVVDADLQVFQPRAVQPLDALSGEQIAVGDESGNDPLPPNVPDHLVQLGMQQRLAPADGDHRRSQRSQPVHAPEQLPCGHGRREVVILVAVGAGKIAPAHGDQMHQQRVLLVQQAPPHARPHPSPAMRRFRLAPDFCCQCRHAYESSPLP